MFQKYRKTVDQMTDSQKAHQQDLKRKAYYRRKARLGK